MLESTAAADEGRILYQSISRSESEGIRWPRRLLRYAVFTITVVAFAGLALDKVIDGFIENSHSQMLGHRASIRGAVELVAVGPQSRPYKNEASCKPGSGVCLCTKGYRVVGQDPHGFNIITPQAAKSESTACQPWKFKVGDMLFVEKPNGAQGKYQEAEIVARFTGSPVVHNALVSQVPPPGVEQTGENVIITEALKGQWRRVLQNSIRTLVERYPFGGISIRRVDETRYPKFFSPAVQAAMTHFANSIVGQPFDTKMVNPAKKQLFTEGRFISPGLLGQPACSERIRAQKMYEQGGPGKWICTQVLAWTIGFAGGLNENKTNTELGCDAPKWLVTNMQPNPGTMLTADFVAPGEWRVPCGPHGCFIGVPADAEWAGGTTGLPKPKPTAPPTQKAERYIKVFNAIGCPNSNPDVSYWAKSSDADTLKDMYPYCSLTKAGKASTRQRNQCCGSTSSCTPGSCTELTSFPNDIAHKAVPAPAATPTPTPKPAPSPKPTPSPKPASAAFLPPDGDWSWSHGHTDATIHGAKLIDTNSGISITISAETSNSFDTSDGYGGGSATFTQDKIKWVNGKVWTRVQDASV